MARSGRPFCLRKNNTVIIIISSYVASFQESVFPNCLVPILFGNEARWIGLRPPDAAFHLYLIIVQVHHTRHNLMHKSTIAVAEYEHTISFWTVLELC